jgi:hypothetical protein
MIVQYQIIAALVVGGVIGVSIGHVNMGVMTNAKSSQVMQNTNNKIIMNRFIIYNCKMLTL